MHRFLIYMLFVLFVTLPAVTALAQSRIQVRGAQHKAYSRIVFDAGRTLPYSLEKISATDIIVKFEEGGSLDLSGYKAIDNIGSIEQISDNPVEVEITLSSAKKVRHFKIGKRIIVDVYNGDDSSTTPPKSRLQDEAAQKKEIQPQDTSKSQDVAQKKVPVPEVTTHEPSAPKVLERRIKPNLITLSSTTSTSMAIFELYGRLWLVNDKEDLLLSPQISGPNKQEILPLEKGELPGARLFKINMIKGANASVQGGGLLWRLILSSQKNSNKPVAFVRQNVPTDRTRGGSIFWPFEGHGEIIDATDPYTGEAMKIVTVDSAKQFSGDSIEFLEFKTLRAPLGLVIVPKVDDLKITKLPQGIEITRPGGLMLTSEEDIQKAYQYRSTEISQRDRRSSEGLQPAQRLFAFENWQLGGIETLRENHNIIFSSIHEMAEEQRYEGLLNLARMYLSNALGAEALGFLNLVQENLPEIKEHPEYKALVGVAQAMSGQSEEAFETFRGSIFEEKDEVRYWKSAVLADLGDWQQAEQTLPQNFEAIYDYPAVIALRLALSLAEVALRAGDLERSDELLRIAEKYEEYMNISQKANLNYLRGEAARQRGELEDTEHFWEDLTTGEDDLYRAKAGLALTRLRVEEGKLTPTEAIDSLEHLRYAWRGDDLEAQINYWLGKTYFEAGEYVKGLNTMRDAASYANGKELRSLIAIQMGEAFSSLFLDKELLAKVPPPEAATVFERFSELMPPGETGSIIAQNLAEHLVASDIFARADELFQYQLDQKLTGPAAFVTATRLAAIRLIDRRPDEALAAIDQASGILQGLPAKERVPSRYEELAMLRSSAYAQKGRSDQALDILRELEKTPEVNRLRADIAWKASYWDDAAEAIHDVILDEKISLTRPLEKKHSDLILQYVVALNLANDRIRLANARERYTQAMNQTDKARIFEVITRPRQSAVLADRATLESIVSEVDMFSDFLESYKEAAKVPE